LCPVVDKVSPSPAKGTIRRYRHGPNRAAASKLLEASSRGPAPGGTSNMPCLPQTSTQKHRGRQSRPRCFMGWNYWISRTLLRRPLHGIAGRGNVFTGAAHGVGAARRRQATQDQQGRHNFFYKHGELLKGK